MHYPSVLILGGSGFVGTRLVAQLSAGGRRICVPTRRYERAKHLTVFPAVQLIEADIHDDAALQRLIQSSDAVINLVGVLHSRRGASGTRYGPDFAKAHVELPRRVVAACAKAGESRYLHMSALGADANGPSMYLRSKADGERQAFANPVVTATAFRPSVIFGEHDRFLNLFATLQKWLPVMLLGGADARFQPVYVGDVAQAFCDALDDRNTMGKIIELAGPDILTLRELVRLAGIYSGHPRPIFGLPEPLARLQALLLECLPGEPLMSCDNLDSMKTDNVLSGRFASRIAPTSLAAVAPLYLAARGKR